MTAIVRPKCSCCGCRVRRVYDGRCRACYLASRVTLTAAGMEATRR